MTESPLDPQELLGLTGAQLPRHIAIIMDGNGRWAKERKLSRVHGHEEGAKTVRTIVTHCARLGIEVLTLYSFSIENWRRPEVEVGSLMNLYARYLLAERATIMDNNVRFMHLGRREGLPETVLIEMDRNITLSRNNTGLKLCLALNYGGRQEIADALRTIARDIQEGRVDPSSVNETLICGALYTAGLPDPDLLIRTAGEQRVSNFLLWQIAYAELHVCDKLWPEFEIEDLNAAIRDFAGRERRFGGVSDRMDEQRVGTGKQRIAQ
jgi:undecaprenyl diphosphate synthase